MRPIRPTLAAASIAAALALAATACGPSEDNAGDKPSASASQSADGKITIPDDLKDKLKEHGIDLDKWRDGAWKNWDKDDWLREAEDYVNPIIEDLWDPDRMRDAEEPEKEVDESDLSGDQGVTDPTPASVDAEGGVGEVPRQRGRGGQGVLRRARGHDGLLGDRRAGPGQPRQVQHGVDGRPLCARRQVGRLVPQHRLRAVVQRQRPVDVGVGDGHQGGGRSVRRVVGRLGADLGPVDRAGRCDGR